MTPRTPPAGRSRRRFPALRRLRPSTAAAIALIVLFGGTSAADAANGGNFLLGRSNAETATATLANSKGTPLSLSAPSGKAPLSVNQQAMVKNLNAEFTGGFTAAELETTGGVQITPVNTITGLSHDGVVVADTGPLPDGLYYISATASLVIQQADSGGWCAVVKASDPGTILNFGSDDHTGHFVTAETAAALISGGDSLQEVCHIVGTGSNSYAADAGIFAIRIKANA